MLFSYITVATLLSGRGTLFSPQTDSVNSPYHFHFYCVDTERAILLCLIAHGRTSVSLSLNSSFLSMVEEVP